jgi:arylsulfatase A-like enzyme
MAGAKTMRSYMLLMTLVLSAVPAFAGSDRPNILFIMSDDHAAPAISTYGGFLAEAAPTPNIDRLAKEGMLLRNCFCTNSICTPSRAVVFTGKYSHLNGVYKFTALDQSQPTLPKLMRRSGYHTGFIGKYHLHSNPVGLDYWSILPGQGRYHDPQFVEMGDEDPSGWVKKGKRTVYQGHSSDVIADKALEYLKNVRSDDKPFLLFCHFKAPHDTWQCAARYEELFADVQIPEPSTLFDDYATRSDALKNTLQFIGSKWGHHTDFVKQTAHVSGEARKKAQYQLYIKKYLRCVRGVDDNVGRILEYLDESGLTENTIVVYTADQGFFLGEHGLYDKRFMYEEALRIPLLIRWPGRVAPGSVNHDIVLNLDFAPTLLAAAKAAVPQDMQGRSFLPLMEGDAPSDWRTSMYYRYYYSHFATEPHYGIRTRTHKLIYFDRIKQWELFDLTKDPHELNNVHDDAAYADVVKRLKDELVELQAEFKDAPADVGDHPRTGFESKR